MTLRISKAALEVRTPRACRISFPTASHAFGWAFWISSKDVQDAGVCMAVKVEDGKAYSVDRTRYDHFGNRAGADRMTAPGERIIALLSTDKNGENIVLTRPSSFGLPEAPRLDPEPCEPLEELLDLEG